MKIPVIEIFGPTIQGEGRAIGQKTMFVRTAGCDYRCHWCDSAFTWDGSEKDRIRLVEAEEIYDELKEIAEGNFQYVTISGGNPALIGKPMAEFIQLLRKDNIKVGIETQGSKWQEWFGLVDDLTISPKPPSSGMATDLFVLDDIISRLPPEVLSLKVVVFDDNDFLFAKKIHKRYPDAEIFLSVGNYNPNETGDISTRLLKSLEWLWEKVIKDPEMNNVRALPQLHALVWSNKREV